MKNNILPVISGILLATSLIQCSKSDINDQSSANYCDGVSSNYTSDVQPIINTYCMLGTSCHSPGSTNAGGELDTYTKVYAKRFAIRDAVYSGVMPQTGSLAADQKKKIVCWVDHGAQNN